jgi:hypothetical protein
VSQRKMAVIGPGAAKQIPTDLRPTLEGASEFEYITVLNPLTDDFAVRVGQDVAVNAPFTIGKDTSGKVNQMTNTEQDARQIYGLGLKNPDFVGRKHITIDTIIPAGQTRRFKGNEAQVAVRQIVNELIQREGHTKMLSDPEVRAAAEARVIQGRGSIQDLMDAQMQTPRSQADEAIRKSNEEQNAQPFSGLNREPSTETGTTSEDSGTDSVQQERRSPGRPRQDK